MEFTTWKVRAIGDTGGRRRRERCLPEQAGAPRARGERSVYLAGRNERLPIYDGSTLGSGAVIAGPAIIEETTTTLLLLDGQTATTDAFGNYGVQSKEASPAKSSVRFT